MTSQTRPVPVPVGADLQDPPRAATLLTGLALLTLGSLAVMAVLGRFHPLVAADTQGYIELGSYPDLLARPRAPFYGAMVEAIGGDRSFWLIPALNFTFFAAAAWAFAAALRRVGASLTAALCTAAALLLSDALNLNVAFVHPELTAISFALLAFASAISGSGRDSLRQVALTGLCCGCAYLLRPSFLLLIPVLPATTLVVARLRGMRVRVLALARLAIVVTVPFVGIAGWRYAVLGSPTIVSFGGFQMSGMASLMLSPDVVARLPEAQRPLAEEILRRREAGEQDGRWIGVPVDPEGQRSYEAVVMSSFGVFSETYDQMLYAIIRDLQLPGESWVAFDKRLQGFSLAVVRAAPKRYVEWEIGATATLVGQAVVKNTPLMLAATVGAALWVLLALTRNLPRPDFSPDFSGGFLADQRLLVVLALAWLVASGAVTVLVTYPAPRYVYTAALLLAPPVVRWAVFLFRAALKRNR